MSRFDNSDQTGSYLFHYNAASKIPVHVQIEEQVKVALALGKLRPGDMLPSIRNVEDTLIQGALNSAPNTAAIDFCSEEGGSGTGRVATSFRFSVGCAVVLARVCMKCWANGERKA